ncbi:maleylpyruvate isomerase family mycothiol-dependent enzyme [Spirillospora sp. NPDC048911]|uniref:maleylpyruvate isomerase family mycothiol-dependent enzyme n=1 Tax=Spirillospora sp. NPDC048911 TaxID=3364527 RepID=UPI0037162646
MDYYRHCTEIVTQTELLVAGVAGADLRAPVPSCPGWSLGNLVRHIGGGHRWAEEVVRKRAMEWLPDDQVRKVDGDDSGELLAAWLVEGAMRFAEALRAAGPDAELWVPFGQGTTSFWARRFAHETLIHRADAALAAGVEFVAESDVLVDAFDEWMELDSHPLHFEITPRKRELLGPGRTLAFEAPEASWFVDLTGDVIAWRRGKGQAAVTVRGPLTELLLVLYQRKPSEGVEVLGDRRLLDFWRTYVTFG